DQAGHRKMDRQPLLGNLGTPGEARGDHPPADAALGAAEQEHQEETGHEPWRNRTPRKKDQERQQEGEADQASEQAMGPFPPVDVLERVEGHAGVQQAILRGGLVLGKLAGPIGVAQWWPYPRDGTPLDD